VHSNGTFPVRRSRLEDLQGLSLTELGSWAEPIRVHDGELTPASQPGHSIVFDAVALARHEVTGRVTGITPTRS
jgi:hypothetical protein